MGDVLAGMFPQTAANMRSADADAGAAYQKGEVLRAIGASSRKLVSAPAGLAYDLTVPVLSGAGRVAADLAGGVISGASIPDAAAAKGPRGAKAEKADKPERGQVLSIAPVSVSGPAPAPMRDPTVHERAYAAIDSILSRPFTMQQFAAATGALPGVAQASQSAVKGVPKMSDVILGLADEQSKAVHSEDIARIQDAWKKDQITEDQMRAQVRQSQLERAQYLSGLAGANPMQLAQAQMLANAQQQEQE